MIINLVPFGKGPLCYFLFTFRYHKKSTARTIWRIPAVPCDVAAVK